MRHLLFTNTDTGNYRFAVLIKDTGLKKQKIVKHYIQEMESCGVDREHLIAFSLEYDNPKKVTAKTAKAYLSDQLLPVLQNLNTEYLLVADPNYFKFLTGVKKTEPYHGAVLPCSLKGWEDKFHVVLAPNHGACFHNPDIQDKIDLDIRAMCAHADGTYKVLGEGIIHGEEYPDSLKDFERLLKELMDEPIVSCDTETFSLKHYAAGLGTIAFAKDQHHGWAHSLDKRVNKPLPKDQTLTSPRRRLLRWFFENYKGKVMYHNASYDIKILIYELYMEHLLDQEGMLKGLEILTRNFHDTKIITYLATNSTGGNKLGLKDQGHEFAGNYAEEDIDDITKIDEPNLLRYNLVDCLTTWFVFNKHYQTMVDDKQLWIYENIMIPSLKVIIQMELTGMCVDMNRVLSAIRRVDRNLRWFTDIVMSHPAVQSTINYKRTIKLIADNEKLKTKKRLMSDDCIQEISFNAASIKDLQILLHEVLQYPIIDLTDSKEPSTGAKTLKKHGAMHAKDPSEVKILKALRHIADASIIRNNFLKNFAEAYEAPDGMHYIFGNFNLGGTVSGRLSSSKPKMFGLFKLFEFGKTLTV